MSVIKRPSECSEQELEEFTALVIQGGQVTPNGLETRIQRARLLAFYYEDEKLIGVAAIKEAYTSYANRIFNNANEPDKAKEYQSELGWAYTLPDYRRRGISSELIEELLGVYENHDLFATTGVNNKTMENILENHGFRKCGLPYKGREEHKQLYIKDIDNHAAPDNRMHPAAN